MTKTKVFFICLFIPIFLGSIVLIALFNERELIAIGVDFDVLMAVLIFIYASLSFLSTFFVRKEFLKEAIYGTAIGIGFWGFVILSFLN